MSYTKLVRSKDMKYLDNTVFFGIDYRIRQLLLEHAFYLTPNNFATIKEISDDDKHVIHEIGMSKFLDQISLIIYRLEEKKYYFSQISRFDSKHLKESASFIALFAAIVVFMVFDIPLKYKVVSGVATLFSTFIIATIALIFLCDDSKLNLINKLLNTAYLFERYVKLTKGLQ